jgi:hypothetical protein
VMQCRQLGAAVEAWDNQGRPVIDEVGELVCTQPLPSMPLYFWGDADNRRYRASYFEHFAPGQGRRPGGGDTGPEAGAVWRHGDWIRITPEGGCVIYGRSDATINRHGLRMGTSEIYRAVEALPEVLDSLVVDLEYLGRESHMPLFVVLRPGVELDAALRARIDGAVDARAQRRLAALRARRHPPGRGGAAHAQRQGAGAADQAAAAGKTAGAGRQQGHDGQSRLPGLVRGAGARAPGRGRGHGWHAYVVICICADTRGLRSMAPGYTLASSPTGCPTWFRPSYRRSIHGR